MLTSVERSIGGFITNDSRHKKGNTRYVRSPKKHSKRASGNKGVVKEEMTKSVIRRITQALHRYEKRELQCPMCNVPWKDMNFDLDNPNCKEEITCVECQSKWRLVK